METRVVRVIFFLKATPMNVPGAKSVGLDPVAAGFACGGADKYCSTAFSNLYGSLKDAS